MSVLGAYVVQVVGDIIPRPEFAQEDAEWLAVVVHEALEQRRLSVPSQH
jgi:hypothetical protein